MNLEQLKAHIATLLKEANGLREKSKAGTLTEDEGKRFDELVTEIRAKQAEVEKLQQRAKDGDDLDALSKHYTEPVSERADLVTAVTTKDGREELMTIGRKFTNSDEFKDYLKHRGKTSRKAEVGSFWHLDDDGGGLLYRHGAGPVSRKALVATGGLPATIVTPQRVPGIFMGDFIEPTVRSAAINGRTTSNLIQFIREDVAGRVNAAAFVAEATATGGSSGTKPESTLAFEEDEASVRTVATWIPITNQTVDDVPQMQSIIESRLLDFLAQAEDDALLNGDGIAPNPLGLLNTTGIQVADDAYFTGAPVLDAGDSNEDFNRIVRAKRLVRRVGLASPDFIIISPEAEEFFLTTTNANRDYYAGSPFGQPSVLTLRGLTVIVSDKLEADDQAVVGDSRMWAVWDRMLAQISIDTINDQFIRNMKTILAEERLAVTVFRPAGFVDLELKLVQP